MARRVGQGKARQEQPQGAEAELPSRPAAPLKAQDGSTDSAPARQTRFDELGSQDGWTLIGDDDAEPSEESSQEPSQEQSLELPQPIAPTSTEPALAASPEPEPEPEPEPDQPTALEVPREPAIVARPEPFRPILAPPAAAVPRRSRAPGLALLATLALVSLGALLWQMREARALERELALAAEAAVPDTGDDAELAALRGEAEALGDELARARAAAAQAEAVARERDELAGTVAALEQRQSAALDLLAEREREQQALRLQAEAQRAEAERLSAVLAAERQRPAPLAPAPIGPAEQRADTCDRMLARLAAGEGARARALLQEAIASGLFVPAGGDGSAFLGALVAGASALESAGLERSTSLAPATTQLLAARTELELALSLRASFAAQAADWLDRQAAGRAESQAAERLGRVDRALESLAAGLEELAGDFEALHGRDWQWLEALGAAQDPALAVAHAGRFACEHADLLAAAYAARLMDEACPSGSLDLTALAAAEHLPAWAERAAARAPGQRPTWDLDLLWLDAARRWYLEGELAEGFDWRGLERPEVLERGPDWRAELDLRVRLAAADSAWPPRAGSLAVYRVSGGPRAMWRSDSRAADDVGTAGWTWRRAHFGDDGTALGGAVLVRVECSAGRSTLADSELVLLDLRALQPGCEVAPMYTPSAELPPPVSGAGEIEVLDLAVRADRSSACLLVPQGDSLRWFSPELGLLREERRLADAVVRVELAAIGERP